MYQKNDKISIWNKCERIILLLTFVCTAFATFYSVRTASTSLKLARIDMRPWISIPKRVTDINEHSIQLILKIENIGKLPAYYSITQKTYIDNKLIYKDGPLITNILSIMPNDRFNFNAVNISGDVYNQIKDKTFKEEIRCITRINYGMSEDEVGEYFTEYEYSFKASKFPENLYSKNTVGLWPFERSDFR